VNDRANPPSPHAPEWWKTIAPWLCAAVVLAAAMISAPPWWAVPLIALLPLFPLMPASFYAVVTGVAIAAAVLAGISGEVFRGTVFHTLLALAAVVLLAAHLAGKRGPMGAEGGWKRYAALARQACTLTIGLLCVALMIRGFPLIATGCWFVFAVMAWQSLPSPPPVPWRTRVAAAIGTAIMLTLSVGLSAAIVEIGARQLFERSIPYARIFRLDTTYFKRLQPGAQTTYYIAADEGVWKPVEVSISPQGLRDRAFGPKAENETRILMLGDSFVFGFATQGDETIPKYLERELNQRVSGHTFSVINGGLGGTGVWQHRGLLNDKGFDLDPDIVIHGIFPFNDITDGLLRDFDDQIEYHVYWVPDRLITFRNRTRLPVRIHEWFRTHSDAYDVIRNRLLDDTGFLPFVNRIRPIRPLEFEPYNTGLGRDPFMEVNLEPWPRDVERGFEILKEDIEGIHADCEAHGVPYIVYTIPHFLDLEGLDPELFDRAWEQGREIVQHAYSYLLDEDFDKVWGEIDTEAQYNPGKALRRTRAYLETTDIPVIDVVTPIEAHPDPISLYYLLDRHFNASGHQFVAEILAEALLSEHAHLLEVEPAREQPVSHTPGNSPAR